MSSVVLNRFATQFSRRIEEKRRELDSLNSGNHRSKFAKLIDRRLKKDQDARIVVAGEGGVGKSTFALRYGEVLNPQLYIDRFEEAVDQAVSFTAKQYMNGVRTLGSETVLDFDEPGQAWYHRQFMSEANMILAKTMLGFRFKRFITFLQVPNIDLLDLDALRLVNWLVWIPNQGHAEVFKVMVQKFGGDPWYKKIIDDLRFSKPGTKLWNTYEKKKFAAQDELYEKYGKKLDELDQPRLTNTEIIEIVKKDPQKYMKNGFLYVPYLQKEFKIGLNKGYLIKAVFETEKEEVEKPDLEGSEAEAADLLRRISENA